MKDITVKFVDFWRGFNPDDNFLLNLLRKKYNVTVLHGDDCGDKPQVLFFSAFGNRHLGYSGCQKIYFTGENDVPDFNFCDYAVSFHDIGFGDRHLRYPLYAMYSEFQELRNGLPQTVGDDALLHRGFCSVVISNVESSDPMREDIWRRLDAYRSVASGGRYRNNVGGPVDDKTAFIGRYKFNLALENSMVDDYTTEKIVEPFVARTVPVYWGNRRVGNEFNREAFVDISDFATVDRAVEYVKMIDNDDDAYLAMLHAPKLTADGNVDWDERLGRFLSEAIDGGRRYVTDYGYTKVICSHRRIKEYLYDRRLLRGLTRRYLGRRGRL